MNVYPLDLGATEAQQTTIGAIAMLPCTFKIIFGFISDQVPLLGYRRKGYMWIGWIMSAAIMIHLFLTSNLNLNWKIDGNVSIPKDAPTIERLSFSFLIFGFGFWMADVMGDSIVAERAKLEPASKRGQLQSTCYAFRFFGLMVAAPVSTLLYDSNHGPRNIVLIMAIIPLVTMGPLMYFMEEIPATRILSARQQCQEIWTTVCSRAVWQPMGFVYVYNILQVRNGAWRQFLKTCLGFSDDQLNALLIAAYILLYVGTLAYKYYFIRFSWRLIFQVGVIMNFVFSTLQMLLITGQTFGLSPFMFALGDDVFADLISGIQFLPLTIMMVHLCPDGSEGASYAMYTTVSNSAMLAQPAISTMLLGIWDVSRQALEDDELSGLLKLTILTTLIQTSAILFVGLLPKDRHELELLKTKVRSTSKLGGAVFLGIIFTSTLNSTIVGLLNILHPGWVRGS